MSIASMSRVTSYGAVLVVACAGRARAQCAPELISQSAAGVAGNQSSGSPVSSRDGRWIAFASRASNLSSGPFSTANQIYLVDRTVGAPARVSVTSTGAPGNANSSSPRISADGSRVAFISSATNLVSGDTNGKNDAFVFDVATGAMVRVNVSAAGVQSSASTGFLDLSPCGDYVAFWSTDANLVPGDVNNTDDVYLRDLTSGSLEIVSVGAGGVQGNGASSDSSISEGGRFVAFSSFANNLVPNDTNGFRDIFVRDRWTGVTILVSKSSAGDAANGGLSSPRISADGSTVVFWGPASNLTLGDTNNALDVFAHELASGITSRISLRSDGGESNGDSSAPHPSATGRYVVFSSIASNLAPLDTNGKWDVFRHDRVTGETRILSVSPIGISGDDDSYATGPSSPDGTIIAFESQATTLIPNDNNGFPDVFELRCTDLSIATYCTAKLNSLACVPAIASSGFASASAATTFDVTASEIISHRLGLLFYGYAPASTPFLGGIKCVGDPVRRLPVQSSGGTAGVTDCSGVYGTDFNAWIAAGGDPVLAPGAVAYCQYWYRDPASFGNTGLTDALRFTILP